MSEARDRSPRPTIFPHTEDMRVARRAYVQQRNQVTADLATVGITPNMESYQGTRRNFTRQLTGKEIEIDRIRRQLQGEQQAHQATAEALEKADTDPVSGVYTRPATMRRLNEAAEWHRAHRNADSTVAFIDLNGMKERNDKGGHEAGDKYLREVGDTLREDSRGTDIVGRYGGDEFLVLLNGTPFKKSLRWILRVKTLFAERGISASMGFATFDRNDPAGSVNEADQMMYRTKRAWYGQQGKEPR